MAIYIATFYSYFNLSDPASKVDSVRVHAHECGVLGTVLVAAQGINSTMSGRKQELLRFIEGLCQCTGASLDDVNDNVKWSEADASPFRKVRVKLVEELITFRQPDADPLVRRGEYVKPSEWNALIARDDVTLVDARNRYEVSEGKFAGAIDPQIDTFTEFAAFVDSNLSPDSHPSVAMYCTGGIRCEVATSYLLHKGFQHVYHLQGGILRYLEQVPADASTWQGTCFVFDERRVVDHDLAPADPVDEQNMRPSTGSHSS